MPFCCNCGSPVGEYDKFCSRCGYTLAPPPPNPQNALHSRYPPKPLTNLENGIFIGIGLAILVVGLLITLSLNGVYTEQVNYLAIQGMQVNPYAFFEGLVLWISTGVFMSVFGVYFLIWGIIYQFSATARTAINLKNSRARWGNGLINGGFIFTALSANSAVAQYYRSTFTGASTTNVSVNVFLITIGLILILLGTLLIRSAYLRNQRIK